ncbi:MAG: hypothetical protein ABMA64_31720 [Myxococcota bacterium]
MFGWLAACASPGADDLWGARPGQSLPAPEFSEVIASEGGAREREDLLGYATAMWFYPAAATSG